MPPVPLKGELRSEKLFVLEKCIQDNVYNDYKVSFEGIIISCCDAPFIVP